VLKIVNPLLKNGEPQPRNQSDNTEAVSAPKLSYGNADIKSLEIRYNEEFKTLKSQIKSLESEFKSLKGTFSDISPKEIIQ